jgi:hypothetical protein
VGGHLHASAALTPEKTPGTNCTRGCVGPRAGLEWCGKFAPTGIRSPDRPRRRESLYGLRHPGPRLGLVPEEDTSDGRWFQQPRVSKVVRSTYDKNCVVYIGVVTTCRLEISTEFQQVTYSQNMNTSVCHCTDWTKYVIYMSFTCLQDRLF